MIFLARYFKERPFTQYFRNKNPPYQMTWRIFYNINLVSFDFKIGMT